MKELVREGITIVGTAHVSPTSVAEVESAIRETRPTRVLVELDPARLKALRDPEAWQNTDIFQIIRDGKQHLFLVQLYLAAMQAEMGRKTGVSPGTELLRAAQVAEEVGAELVLIDRDVSITIRRGLGSMGFWARVKLLSKVWMQLMTPSDGTEPPQDTKEQIERLLETDALTQMTEEFARIAPDIKRTLIDERDAYMASHIEEQAAKGGSLVAVVGAGHLAGIRAHLANPEGIPDRERLLELPRKRVPVGKIIGWAIPITFVAFFVYLGLSGQVSQLVDQLTWFILITGGLSALGAALAFGHPLSILTAFLAAPIGVLHPLLATGWFSGLVEAKVRTPKVADFQAIKQIQTLGQFWRNGVVRVLLVTALTNVGAMVSTTVIGARIFQSFGGP